MAEKYFITPNELLQDSYDLAKQIYDSGFRPDFMMALWRGGTTIGIAVHEYLQHQEFLRGVKTRDRFGPDHIPIRTSRYNGIGDAEEEVNVTGLGYFFGLVNADSKLLIVDDTSDAGTTVDAVINETHELMGSNTPRDIRVAVVHDKPNHNKTGRVPDFCLYETDHWLVYPHEIMGLTEEEIRIKNEIMEGKRQNAVSLQRRFLERLSN